MRHATLTLSLCCTSFFGMLLLSQTGVPLDNDQDGLDDAFEDALLKQFQPQLMVSREDCSIKPAQFAPFLSEPTVLVENGILYAQAFPRGASGQEVELHYYHLWRKDCGQISHPLDAEHVSLLLRADTKDATRWRAIYWYAAAHEDTVCDASQVTRASTLKAETHGTTVWISAGKHASFFRSELCSRTCGGDRCVDAVQIASPTVVNVGELQQPMNGAIWIGSHRWPVAAKMSRTDFSKARLARLERLPVTDIAWANPSKRPTQTAILGGNSAVAGVAIGGRSTDTALVLANDKTTEALGTASRNTGNALTKTFQSVRKALGGATRRTEQTLANVP